jgi:hypothetical protein
MPESIFSPLLISDVLGRLILRTRERPLPLEIYRLLAFEHGYDSRRIVAGSPCSIESQDDHVDPFLEVGRLSNNLCQLLQDMVSDANGPRAGAESLPTPFALTLYV